MKRRALLIACLLALLAPQLFAARATVRRRPVYAAPRPRYEMIYGQGMISLEIKDWPQVVANMSAAIRENPIESATPVRLERSTAPYLPHYYLGIALCELGPSNVSYYTAAVAQLRESERQGVIQHFPAEYRLLQTSATRAAFQAVVVARPRYDNVDGKKPDAFTSFFDSIAAPVNRFVTDNGAVRAVVTAAALVRRGFGGAAREEAIVRQAEAEKASREREELARGDMRRQIEKRIDAGRNLVTLAGREKAQPATEAARDLEGVISRAALLASNAPLSDLQDISDRLDNALANTRAALQKAGSPNMPPALLFDATASFFAGDYARSVSVLDAAAFDDARATVQALMVRAAARQALYLAGGEKDRTLLDRAAEDVKQCRRLDPKIAPPQAFSPVFRQFFGANG